MMKSLFLHALVAAGLFVPAVFTPLAAQWLPHAVGIFDAQDWVDQVRVADADHVWAGVTNAVDYGGNTSRLPRLAHTADGGSTWQTTTIPGTENYLGWGLSLLGTDTVFWSLNRRVSSKDRIYRSTDAGQSWQLLLEDTAAGYQVHFFDGQNGIVYRGPYNMKITSDGGQTWQIPAQVPPGLAGQGIFNYPGSDVEVLGNSFFGGLEDGKFFKSTDRGQTWQAFATPFSTPISDLAFESESTGLAAAMFSEFDPSTNTWYTGGKPSRLARTTDGGQTWAEIPAAQLPLQGDSLFISVLEATGAPGEYVLEGGKLGTLNYFTFRTTDGGASWQELSRCPSEPIGAMDFKSPDVGWAGNAFLQSPGDGMFFKWGTWVTPKSKFSVDLGGLTASPDGVHLALDIFGWNPAAAPMTHLGGNLWAVEVSLPPNSTVRYRFVNGLTAAQAETVPAGCGEDDNGTSVRSVTTPECSGVATPTVLFGHCLPNGDLVPQQATTPCDANFLICETFDNYLPGKIGPQSDIWTSYGCDFDGTEGDECDVDLNGYVTGFSNFSGQWALHPNGKDGGNGQYIELNLGNLTAGRYELSMKMYVPAQRTAFTALVFSDSYSSVDLYFSSNGQLAYSKYSSSAGTYETEATVNFETDKWLDLRFIFDMGGKKREFWLGNALVSAAAADPDLEKLVNMSFSGSGGAAGLLRTEFLVDDLILRDLDIIAAPDLSTDWSFLISPNPATDFLSLNFPKNAAPLPTGLTAVVRSAHGLAMLHQPVGERTVFDVSALPTGLYWVVLQDADGRIWAAEKWMKPE